MVLLARETDLQARLIRRNQEQNFIELSTASLKDEESSLNDKRVELVGIMKKVKHEKNRVQEINLRMQNELESFVKEDEKVEKHL